MTVQEFAAEVQAQQRSRFIKEYGPQNTDGVHQHAWVVTVKPGNKYTRVDVGPSGKYMVVNATGEIFGIKGYGVVHRGHAYGTLNTVHEWDWSDYVALRRPKLQVTKAQAGPGVTCITIGWDKAVAHE